MGRNRLDGIRDPRHAEEVQPLESRTIAWIGARLLASGCRYVRDVGISRQPVLRKLSRHIRRHCRPEDRHDMDLYADE